MKQIHTKHRKANRRSSATYLPSFPKKMHHARAGRVWKEAQREQPFLEIPNTEKPNTMTAYLNAYPAASIVIMIGIVWAGCMAVLYIRYLLTSR